MCQQTSQIAHFAIWRGPVKILRVPALSLSDNFSHKVLENYSKKFLKLVIRIVLTQDQKSVLMHWFCLPPALCPAQVLSALDGAWAALTLLLTALSCTRECRWEDANTQLFLHMQVASFMLTGIFCVALLMSRPSGFRVLGLPPCQLLPEICFSAENAFRKLLFAQGQTVAILSFHWLFKVYSVMSFACLSSKEHRWEENNQVLVYTWKYTPNTISLILWSQACQSQFQRALRFFCP